MTKILGKPNRQQRRSLPGRRQTHAGKTHAWKQRGRRLAADHFAAAAREVRGG